MDGEIEKQEGYLTSHPKHIKRKFLYISGRTYIQDIPDSKDTSQVLLHDRGNKRDYLNIHHKTNTSGRSSNIHKQ